MSEKNLNIQFNKAIIKHTKDANIQMDLMGSVMFILFGLFDGKVEMLDYADDSNQLGEDYSKKLKVMQEQQAGN